MSPLRKDTLVGFYEQFRLFNRVQNRQGEITLRRQVIQLRKLIMSLLSKKDREGDEGLKNRKYACDGK